MAETKPFLPAAGENKLVDQMLHDVFVTACEGGMNYWASFDAYHWTTNGELDGKDLAGFYAKIVDNEEADYKQLTVNRDTLVAAFERIAAGPVQYLDERSRAEFLTMARARLDGLDDNTVDVDYDAGDADNIVQIGLFGEIIYG